MGATAIPNVVLRTELIRRGDVLLTRGPGVASKFIALFSGGPYSHAACCIDPILVFESDGRVTGNKLIESLGWAKYGNDRVHLGRVPGLSNVSQCGVFRHPAMSNINDDLYKNAYRKIHEDYFGKDYSQLRRFTLFFPHVLRQLVNPILAIYDYLTRYKVNGVFCSELVAIFFEQLDLPLFEKERSSNDVSPNDLARSLLKPVVGVVWTGVDLQGFLSAEALRGEDAQKVMASLLITGTRDELSAYANKRQRQIKLATEVLNDIQKHLSRWIRPRE